jgi:hypothetical protein
MNNNIQCENNRKINIFTQEYGIVDIAVLTVLFDAGGFVLLPINTV